MLAPSAFRRGMALGRMAIGYGHTSVIGVLSGPLSSTFVWHTRVPRVLFRERFSMPKSRRGHAPGHVRVCNAIDAFADWNEGEPEPTVEFEVNYVPRPITISQACGLMWNCTDILPRLAVSQLEDVGVEFKRQTYAAAAH